MKTGPTVLASKLEHILTQKFSLKKAPELALKKQKEVYSSIAKQKLLPTFPD